MKNSEKCKILQDLKSDDTCSVSSYYEALENIGDMKYNYGDYMITEPIDCHEELKRLPSGIITEILLTLNSTIDIRETIVDVAFFRLMNRLLQCEG